MLNKILKTIVVILIVLFIGILSINIGAETVIRSMLSKTQEAEEIHEEAVNVFDIDTAEEIENIVLLGIDSEDGSTRSDAIKLISMNKTNHKITITSLQRDVMVYQPLQDRYEKLNHAYWYNRAEGALAAINYNYDLDTTKYIALNFDSIEHLVNIVGGVDIELTQAEINQQIRPVGVSGGPGVYHLDGVGAVNYSRIRTIDDDYIRMNRQNNVIKAIIKQVRSKSIPEILSIVNEVMPYVETNLTASEIKDYAMEILNYDLNNIPQYQFPSRGMEAVIGWIEVNGWSPNYILDDFSLEVKILHEQIYPDDEYTPSENVLKVTKETRELGGF